LWWYWLFFLACYEKIAVVGKVGIVFRLAMIGCLSDSREEVFQVSLITTKKILILFLIIVPLPALADSAIASRDKGRGFSTLLSSITK
jgi:hypothetical protein